MMAFESTFNGQIKRSLRVFVRFCQVFEIGFKIVVSNNVKAIGLHGKFF
jgi:hypothetical protein